MISGWSRPKKWAPKSKYVLSKAPRLPISYNVSLTLPTSDITDQKQVQELYQEITANLPPIAGVAQGAMVLDDIATRDMTYEQMMKVLRPKVDGSMHLERLFHDQALDFFLSSLVR